MGNRNVNLQHAKNIRDDEFYTTYEDVHEELAHYVRFFAGKTVLCNCDDPWNSNFCRYFLRYFNVLKLRRFICTGMGTEGKLTVTESGRPVLDESRKGFVLDVEYVSDFEGVISEDQIVTYLKTPGVVNRLKGNGDFRSTECVAYLRQADVVVTNPPFSFFRELFSLLMEFKKRFLLVGNQNVLTYKEIFPLIQRDKVWTGYQFGEMKFRVPQSSEPRTTRYWVDDNGQKWRSLGNAMWLTNIDVERRHRMLMLTRQYTPEEFPKYDDVEAVNVRRITDIPYDFTGIMGVPVTIINRYNGQQFEILGEANHGSDNEYDLFKPMLSGRLLFKRILIRNRLPTMKRIEKFRILDLFCGAGGFAYGMERNPNFTTEVAVDFNARAIGTFHYNMAHVTTVVGDITEAPVKSRVIELSRQRGVNMVIGGPPCQGFSLKGKKLGLSDSRNYLFREYLTIVEELKPDIFVIENVKALLSASSGWFKDQILERVTNMGYVVEYGVLAAYDFGVPQARHRAIFICSRIGRVPLPVPADLTHVTVREAISDLAYLASGEGMFEQEYLTAAESDYQRRMRLGSERLYNHQASNHAAIAIKKLMMIPPECGKEHLPDTMKGRQKFSGTWGRLKWDDVSPTIDTRFDAASNGTNNHPVLHRAITPREAARLQSFDDRFVFVGPKVSVRQQIGNAVPPLLAKAIADQIFAVLGRENGGIVEEEREMENEY